jgi:hypothetical protein
MTYAAPQLTPLRYPLWLRLTSAALVAIPLASAWLVWGQPTPAEEWQNVVPYLVLGAWLALTYQVFLVEVYYDERGITYVSPMAGVIRLNWNEIVALYHVRGLDGCVIEADDGRRIWFQLWRTGMDDFADAIQSRLPRQARGGR